MDDAQAAPDLDFGGLDTAISKHIQAATAGETPSPVADDSEPETDAEDTLDDVEADDDPEPEVEVEETDEDEAGDEEPDAEDEEDEEDLEPAAEDDTEAADEESFLPEFDRKKIEADPELLKAYRHMQAAFTRRQQEASEKVREADTLKAQFEEFKDILADDTGAQEFLLQFALARPKVFQSAFERAVELSENEDQKAQFQREQELKRKEQELTQRERLQAQRRQQEYVQEVTDLTHRMADAQGLGPEDYEIAEQFVANKVHENRLKSGKATVEEGEVRVAVQQAKRYIDRKSQALESRATKRIKAEQKRKLKEKARSSKRPSPPRASNSPRPKRKEIELPEGADPLDGIDELLKTYTNTG